MNTTCPKCSASLSETDEKCTDCGFSVAQEFDETIAQSDLEDEQTPTKIHNPLTDSQIHQTTADTEELVAGTVLDERYRILGLLGKGGMGEVYKAQDLKLDQTVALKFLPEKLASNKEALRRFIGEVKTARQVSHENVCRVFDISEINGQHFLSMEFVDGDDLSQLLRRIGRLPSDKAVEISRQICMGLNSIHKTGILHRDLKPANIIIDSGGRARITDFGIAGFEQDVQGAESRVGTPAYMSPEQRAGKEVTQKSDIYSLGLLLYEIFTGEQALDSKTLTRQTTADNSGNLNKSTAFGETIDPTVEKLIERCLEDDPDKRPDSAVRVALGLPGGDPIQVALEAGETPSPEMVAAAGSRGALKPIIAISLLIAMILAFGTTMYWASGNQIHSYTPHEKSPDVLREKAKTAIERFGYKTPPADSADGFSVEVGYLNSAVQLETKYPFERLKKGQPYLQYYWYRQGPEQLVDDDFHKVSENSPEFNQTGSIRLKLDAIGRLVELNVIPPDKKSRSDQREISWLVLFEEAGLDIEKFTETEPILNSPFYSDASKAWKGTLADSEDIPIIVEAAAYNGSPVFFKILMPWDKALTVTNKLTQTRAQYNDVGKIASILIVVLFILGAVFISYHNLKVGRVDLKGAARISIFCFLLQFIGHLVAADHTLSLNGEFSILINVAVNSVFTSFLLFLAYLAIEPFVRRFWSDLLISWNRLLAGEFRDPMVGRDILIGALLGIFQASSFYLGGFLRDYLVSNRLTITSGSNTISGFRDLFEHIVVFSFSQRIIIGVGILLFLLMFYLIFRRKWAGTLASIVVLTFVQAIPLFPVRGWTYVLLQFVVITIIFSAYAKYGLVTIIASLFYASLLNLEITLDPSRFYFSNTVVIAIVAIGIALYSFYISLAGKSLIGSGLLEGETG